MKQTIWNKEQLRLALFSGLIVQVIDWGITEEEEDTCKKFIFDRWLADWGEPMDMYDHEFEAIKEFTVMRATLDEKLDKLLVTLAAELTAPQKVELLVFIKAIADADQQRAPQEDALIHKFTDCLGV